MINVFFPLRFLELALKDTLLTPSERHFLLFTFLHGSNESVTVSLEFVLEHFFEILEIIPSMANLFAGMANYLRTKEQEEIMGKIVNLTEEYSELYFALSNIEISGLFSRINNDFTHTQFGLWLILISLGEPDEGGHGCSITGANIFVLIGIMFFIRVISK